MYRYHIISILVSSLALMVAIVTPTSIAKPGAAACTDRVYAGNPRGRLAISYDAGETWEVTVPVPGPYPVPDIASIYAEGDNVFLATTVGLAVSSNGGQNWTVQYLDGDGDIQHQYVTSVYAIGERVWAGVYSSNGVCISEDNAQTWPINSTLPKIFGHIGDVRAVGSRTYVGTSNGLGISDDDGKTWQHIGKAQGLASDDAFPVALDGNNVYVGGNDQGDWGTITISQDGGETWRIQNTTLVDTWVVSIFAVDGKVYVGTGDAGLSISTDGGKSWVVKTTADGLADDTVWAVAAVGDNIYAGTDSGLSVSRDGGQTWTTKDTGTKKPDVGSIFAHCV